MCIRDRSGFYRFSETGSNDRVDSYNGHILGAIGSPSTAFGVVGDGLSLDGIGQKLYHDKLSHGGSRTRYMGEKGDSFTVSIWVKPADITKQLQFICGKYEDVAGDKNWALHLKNDSVLDQDPYFQFTMWENLTVSTECFVSTGGPENWGGKDYQIQNDQWYHLVAGYDRGNQEVYLYVNNATSGAPDSQNRNDPNGLGGKLVSPYNSCEVVYMEPVVAHKFSIGGEYSNPAGINYFEGTIDLFGCWHKILASGEIKSLWNEGNGLNLPLGSYIPANPKVGGFVKAIEYVDFYPTNEDGTNQVPSGRIDLGGYVSTRAYYVYPQQQYLGGSCLLYTSPSPRD